MVGKLSLVNFRSFPDEEKVKRFCPGVKRFFPLKVLEATVLCVLASWFWCSVFAVRILFTTSSPRDPSILGIPQGQYQAPWEPLV